MANRGPLLEVDHVSKRFCASLQRSLRYGMADIAAEWRPWRRDACRPELRPDEFWALNDISFTLHPGEALAVVGHNGAGKSTLLKLVAGLLKPDAGKIVSTGRQGVVVELGSGFNSLLSGRENAALMLRWRGPARRDCGALLEKVEDFAGLGEMLDAPLLHYSSGMRARLAYALAVAPPSDLLVLDEALAVGDLTFQNKCLRALRAHLDRGGGLLFVSHDIQQLQTICTRGIVLDQGRVDFEGSAVEASDRLLEKRDASPSAALPLVGGGRAQIESLTIVDPPDGILRNGADAEFCLDLMLEEGVEALCSILVMTDDLSHCITSLFQPEPVRIEAGRSRFLCRVPRLPLTGGRYRLRASLIDAVTLHPLTRFGINEPAMIVQVEGARDRFSVSRRNHRELVDLPCVWSRAQHSA